MSEREAIENGKAGPHEQFDAEAMFLWWYADGERKTYVQTADHFGIGYTTVREYADRHDWERRADEIDEEARRQLGKRMARIIARQHSVQIDAVRALQAKFLRRLPETLQDGAPNPAALTASDIEIKDFIDLGKFLELLTGGATERLGNEESERFDLAAIEAEIDELDRRALERGETIDV